MKKVWKLERKVLIVNLIAIFIVVVLTYQVEIFERERQYSNSREIAGRELALAQTSISLKFVTGLNLIEEMRILLAQNVDWSPTDFNEYTSSLTVNSPEIKNIAVARDFVIEYISPIVGNEAAMNLDYRTTPSQFEAANEVISHGHTIITNLIHLVQGGDGVIARVPFLIGQGVESEKWGIISIVWDVDKLFSSLTDQMENMNYKISVRSILESAGANTQIYGSEDVYGFDPITSELPLDGNTWELAIAPLGPWNNTNSTIWGIRLIGLLFFLIILGLTWDRERIKALLQELKASQIESNLANEAKTKFLANISHDLRTPLNAIIGFSAVMKDQLLGKLEHPKYLEYSKDINASSKYLHSLVNDLLDISMLESGNKTLNIEPLDVKTLMLECRNQFARIAEEKNIDIQIEITENIPLLLADKIAMQQVMTNLFSNSLKFTRVGGLLTIKATIVNKQHVIKIIDTGVGISEMNIRRVFEPFVRDNHNPLHSHAEGTGLGLSIVKSLVELHEGKVNIESVVGEGTTITLMIP